MKLILASLARLPRISGEGLSSPLVLAFRTLGLIETHASHGLAKG